ncbi:hypothetical protein D3C77_521600 [compost metagenome]
MEPLGNELNNLLEADFNSAKSYIYNGLPYLLTKCCKSIITLLIYHDILPLDFAKEGFKLLLIYLAV